MSRDYSFGTFEEAKPDAERYCKRDGTTWVMRRPDGRFVIINPHSEEVKRHYLGLGWTVDAELTAFAHHEMNPVKYKNYPGVTGAQSSLAPDTDVATNRIEVPVADWSKPAAAQEVVAEVVKNEAGQVTIVFAGGKTVMDHVGAKFYVTPEAPWADLRKLTDSWLEQAERVSVKSPDKAAGLWACAKELRDWIDASPKGGSTDPIIPTPHQECYSDNDGDSWYDHPADSCLVDGLAVGDTYTLSVSHYSVGRTYRVTKAPDGTSDDYEVEPVQATSAEVGECNCPNGRAECMPNCASRAAADQGGDGADLG